MVAVSQGDSHKNERKDNILMYIEATINYWKKKDYIIKLVFLDVVNNFIDNNDDVNTQITIIIFFITTTWK